MKYLEVHAPQLTDRRAAIEWILLSINEGSFIYTSEMDKLYINNTVHYKKFHHIHPALIVGVDHPSSAAIVLAYDVAGDFRPFSVPLANVALSLQLPAKDIAAASSEPWLFAVKARRDRIREWDLDTFLSQIRCYLGSVDIPVANLDHAVVEMRQIHREWNVRDGAKYEQYYGTAAMTELLLDVRVRVERAQRLDLRATRSLWEHKKIMLANLKYAVAEANARAVDRYQRVVSWAHKLHLYSFELEYNKIDVREQLLAHMKAGPGVLAEERCILSKLG